MKHGGDLSGDAWVAARDGLGGRSELYRDLSRRKFIATDHPDEDALYATACQLMVDLSSAVASLLHALRTLVMLDTCFSGGAVNNGKNGIADDGRGAKRMPRRRRLHCSG